MALVRSKWHSAASPATGSTRGNRLSATEEAVRGKRVADLLETDDAKALLDGLLLVVVGAGDDLDVQLLEHVVEVVDLGRLEVELVERDRDLVGTQLSVFSPRFEERFGVIGLQ